MQVASLEERLAPITEGHGRTVAPGLSAVARRRDRAGDLGINVAAMADDERTGDSRFFDGVLIAGGGLIAILVAFWVLGAIVGFVWGVVKLVLVVAVVLAAGPDALPPSLLTVDPAPSTGSRRRTEVRKRQAIIDR